MTALEACDLDNYFLTPDASVPTFYICNRNVEFPQPNISSLTIEQHPAISYYLFT